MSANRFEFLELGDQAPAAAHIPVTEDEGAIRFDPLVGKSPSIYTANSVSSRFVEEDQVKKPRTLRVMEVFGSRGTVAGAFSYPTGIAVDRNGIIFIADAYNHRLQRITQDAGVAIVGSRGSSKGQFIAPMGVAVDEDRSFYVVEQGNHRLQKFDPDGRFEFAVGREGSGKSDLRSPTGVAVAAGTKTIYIADTGNARVQIFNKAGIWVGVIGAVGSAHPCLSNPQSVACDRLGNVFVADTLAHRILQFDPGGRFVASFGGPPSPSNRLPELVLMEPHAVAIDERGRMLIADGMRAQGRIIAITTDPAAILMVMENVGRGLGTLARPGGIAPAPVGQSKFEPGCERGDVYVSDTMNHRILRFVWS